MTTTTKKITIKLSDRRPIEIDPSQWPIIARADHHDGQVECQANTVWSIKVREHADGRRIVYGKKDSGNGGQRIGWRGAMAGFLLAAAGAESETIRAIRRVAGVIGDEEMGDDAIADLPAETLE